MKLTMDKAGRLVVPRALRDLVGLSEGGTVDVSLYGSGLQVIPAGRTARVVSTPHGPVAVSDTEVTDEIIFGLIDAGRR